MKMYLPYFQYTINDMKKIFIVRHGRTIWNQEGRIQGAVGDSPLLEASIDDARKAGEFLKKYKIDRVFSSPIKRAKTTAELLDLGLPITDLPEVGEVVFGQWESKTREELSKTDPELLDLMLRRIEDQRLRDLGIESFIEAAKRFEKGIQHVISELEDGQSAVVVSHGAVSHMGIKLITGISNLDGLKNTSTTVLQVKDDGKIYLEAFNEVGYLQNPNAVGSTTII
jgi:probable phosphoglycerate mutase